MGPHILTSSFWPPCSPSSPSWACRKPEEPFLVLQRFFLSQNLRSSPSLPGQAESSQLSPGLPPLFPQPLPHLLKLSSPPGQAGPLLGRVTPHLALGLHSGHRRCVAHASPGRGDNPLCSHIGEAVPQCRTQIWVPRDYWDTPTSDKPRDGGWRPRPRCKERLGWLNQGQWLIPPAQRGPRGTERGTEAQRHRKPGCPQANSLKL